MSDNLVLTPGGYRDASLVHHLPPGSVLSTANGRLHHLQADGTLIADYGELQNRAAGRPLHPLNVSLHPDVAMAFDKTVVQGRPCPRRRSCPRSAAAGSPTRPGRTAPARRSRGSTTQWTVPPEPATQNGQTIFLFNGIQNSTMIYQPVCSGGRRRPAAGANGRWRAGTQMARPATRSSARLSTVNVGDVMTGVMTLTGTNGALIDYSCDFTGIATPRCRSPMSRS